MPSLTHRDFITILERAAAIGGDWRGRMDELVFLYPNEFYLLPPGSAGGVEDRVATASRLVGRLTAEGMALEDIFVDPCVLPASTGPEHGMAILEAVGRIKARFPGVHISAGVSNVSYGLPLRKLLNEVFLVLLLGRGLDTAIVDPCDQQMMMNLRAAEALLGRDEYCVAYLRAFRDGKLDLKAA